MTGWQWPWLTAEYADKKSKYLLSNLRGNHTFTIPNEHTLASVNNNWQGIVVVAPIFVF
jgi:hypothetical protein